MAEDSSLISRLEAAREERARMDDRIAEIGEDHLRDLQEAHEQITALLGRYEERATGSGDFKAFIEFQEGLSELVEDLPSDLPKRDVFEDIDERLQKRRLTESDFEDARTRLSGVEDLIGRLDRRREAANRVRSLERQVREAIHETHQEIDRLETVTSLGEADLDAPVEELREPVETYNESVRRAFESFRNTAPAREVLGLVETTQQYPLVDFGDPPEGLAEFLETAPAGEEPIGTLLEYTEFSRSKLGHFVETPATFKRIVGGNRTYLERLDAEPLTVSWPPPDPASLRWRARELISVLNRFVPPETVAALDEVRELARDEETYQRLRQTARARAELSDGERDQIADGRIESELSAARERLEDLESALSG